MVRMVFTDDINPEMELEAFVNNNNRIYIAAGKLRDEPICAGFVTLSKEDAKKFVKELRSLINQMPDEL